MSDPSDSGHPQPTNSQSSTTESSSNTSSCTNSNIMSTSISLEALDNHDEDNTGGEHFNVTLPALHNAQQELQKSPVPSVVNHQSGVGTQQGASTSRLSVVSISREFPILDMVLGSIFANLGGFSLSSIQPIRGNRLHTQQHIGTGTYSGFIADSLNSPSNTDTLCLPFEEHTTIYFDTGEWLRIETGLLKHTSHYFSSIYRFTDAWPESRYSRVELDGVDLPTFDVFRYWLQTGSIVDTDTLLPNPILPMNEDGTFRNKSPKLRSVLVGNKSKVYLSVIKVDKLDQLVQCLILADYIGAPAFQNDIMDALLNEYAEIYYHDNCIPLYNIPFICQNAASGVQLRAFVVDAVYSCLSSITFKKATTFKLISKDLATAVAILGIGGDSLPAFHGFPPWLRNPCTYHVHPKEPLNSPCLDPFTWNGQSQEPWLTWDVPVDWDRGIQW